jgi:hypothetical protein
MRLRKRYKILINYIVGPALLIWLCFSVYHHIQQQKDLPLAWQKIKSSFTGPYWWKFAAVVLLMFFNWGIEAKKWQLLIKGIQRISFVRAFKAIFSGQAFAFNTINNMGEFVGRVMFLEEGNRLRAVAVTVVGSISQIIVTMVMGIIGMLYLRLNLLDVQQHLKGLTNLWFSGLIIVLMGGTLGLIVFYFQLSWITKLVEKIPFVAKYSYFIKNVEDFHWKHLTNILLLSFTRYVVFVAQYLLLLQFFDVQANWLQLSWMVCIMFLVLAIVPSIALAELGLRGEVSKLLIGLLSANVLGIASTAIIIFFINRIIPAVAGSLFILSVRIFKK